MSHIGRRQVAIRQAQLDNVLLDLHNAFNTYEAHMNQHTNNVAFPVQ